MNPTYSIRIVRPGMADIPETCRCNDSLSALAVTQALLDCGDTDIAHVVISVRRVTSLDVPDVGAGLDPSAL